MGNQENEEAIGIAFNILDCFVATINLKYRPEYYQVGRMSFAFTEPFVASNVGAAPLMITFLCINYIYWDSLNRMVFGAKATGSATRFQDSWLECTERNPDTVTAILAVIGPDEGNMLMQTGCCITSNKIPFELYSEP